MINAEINALLYFIICNQMLITTFLFALILCPIATNTLSSIQTDSCPCLNEGTCNYDPSGLRYCNCPPDYIGSNCEQAATNLLKLDQPANITQEYSYFFVQFNSSTLFYIEVFFCPLDFAPRSTLDLQIQFEDQSGSLEQLAASQVHLLVQKQKQCAIAKYVILPFKKKADGQYIRLLIRIKQTPTKTGPSSPLETSSASIGSEGGVSQVNIKYVMYEFYKLSGQSLGQLMAISTLSSILLICISLTICRRLILRRGPRFIYQPAVMVRDISSFDEFMPEVLYPADPQTRQEEKECMICLLNVENTLTRTTPCRHLFHKECIDEWGKKSLTCPTCRYPLQRERADQV